MFLDALAAHRRVQGLPAVSLAWGLWGLDSGMGGALGQADLARFRRSGIAPMPAAEGMALFDAALALDTALVVPAHLDLAALRQREDLPAVYAAWSAAGSAGRRPTVPPPRRRRPRCRRWPGG